MAPYGCGTLIRASAVQRLEQISTLKLPCGHINRRHLLEYYIILYALITLDESHA